MLSRIHEQCTTKYVKGCRTVRSHHLLAALQLEQRGGARGENSEAGACGREHEPRLAHASSRRHSIAEERSGRALVARQHEWVLEARRERRSCGPEGEEGANKAVTVAGAPLLLLLRAESFRAMAASNCCTL